MFRFVDNKYFVPLTIERDKIKKELFVELIFDGVISIYYSDYLNEYYIKNEKGEVFILQINPLTIHQMVNFIIVNQTNILE